MGNIKQHKTKPDWNGDTLHEFILNNNGRSFIQVDRMGRLLQEVEVGAISTQQHAEHMATEHEMDNAQEVWTCQWRTTVPDKMTIIQISPHDKTQKADGKIAHRKGIKKSSIVRGVQGAKGKSFSTPPPVKLRQQLSTLSELHVADHVVMTQGPEETHGIVLHTEDTDNTFTVLEFTKGLRNDGGALFYHNLCVQNTRHVFGEDVSVSVVLYDTGETLSDVLVLSNARGFMTRAHDHYDDISHGCESLARWCKTGQFELDGVDSSFKAIGRYSFWPLVSFLITWNPLYALVFIAVCFSLASGHEGFKRYKDIYKK